METTPDDAENLNAAFRAAHTIKGTAGLFGCEAVVAFTHEVETLMEALRSGKADLECGSSSVTLGRMKQVDFSSFIFVDSTTLLVRRDAFLRRTMDRPRATIATGGRRREQPRILSGRADESGPDAEHVFHGRASPRL